MDRAEFIIVDDRSSPDVAQFLSSMAAGDARFRVIEKPASVPRGSQHSRNIGMAAARGEGIIFLDSDDLLAAGAVRERLAWLQAHPDADIIVGRQAIFSGDIEESFWVNVPHSARDPIDRMMTFSHPIDVPWVNGGVMLRATRLASSGIRWRPEFHWDDVAFHFECLAAGFTVEWMPSGPPDAYYRTHQEDRYGSVLSTADGLRSTAAMIIWMSGVLRDKDKLTSPRLALLQANYFRECVLRAADTGDFPLARHLLADAARAGIFDSASSRSIAYYLGGRSMMKASARATYYWNRLNSALLDRLRAPGKSTYGTVRVNETLPSVTA